MVTFLDEKKASTPNPLPPIPRGGTGGSAFSFDKKKLCKKKLLGDSVPLSPPVSSYHRANEGADAQQRAVTKLTF